MIINDRLFFSPPKEVEEFKELFFYLVSNGAGRGVDEFGFSLGPWTPELLADAISQIPGNERGIDLRTVQLWFQDNDRGISRANIRWLARIFGCGDPAAASEWQHALSSASLKQASRRRNRRTIDQPNDVLARKSGHEQDESSVLLDENLTNIVSGYLVRISYAAFTEGTNLTLASAVFSGAISLGFASYFLGVHSVNIASMAGVSKQVGYLWAPNWTLLFMVFLPLFVTFVADLLFYWKTQGRCKTLLSSSSNKNLKTWHQVISASNFTYWLIFIVCFLFAGVLQWVSIRLMPILNGAEGFAVDWGRISSKHPEVISMAEEVAFTGLAYLYMSFSFYLFFSGLVLLNSIIQDYQQTRGADLTDNESSQRAVVVGFQLLRGIFRCTVLGILIASCMKLQSTFMASDGSDIIRWMVHDFSSAFVPNKELHHYENFRAPNHFSSFLIVLSVIYVFVYGTYQLRPGRAYRRSVVFMFMTITLLTASYITIGAFSGFTLLMCISIGFSIIGLFFPAGLSR